MSEADRRAMRDFYDRLGGGEWDRLEATPRGRVSFEVHRRFLERFIEPGQRVLEVGAGPGRFTFELASRGTFVSVTDYSPVQLELHAQRLSGTDADRAVESRELLDICDTSRYDDATFDAVVAYGGPLSYAFDQAEQALGGLFRITKPGGPVVASVMSLLGSWRFFLRGVLEDTKTAGESANDLVLTTGDLRHFGTEHVCQMFRASDIVRLVAACGGEVLALSASNWASLGDEEVLAEFESSTGRWASFLKHEVRACGEPGAVDGGTHLLFAARRS
ncbi:MAG TPA: methyltransferase domain-containing protein [Acidimicrobiales bacterium]|nr:methyltransferase domain-containing protein [Acidimicrobiales bacterium]